MARVWISNHVPSNASRVCAQHYHWLHGTGTTLSVRCKIDISCRYFVWNWGIVSPVCVGNEKRGRGRVDRGMGVVYRAAISSRNMSDASVFRAFWYNLHCFFCVKTVFCTEIQNGKCFCVLLRVSYNFCVWLSCVLVFTPWNGSVH